MTPDPDPIKHEFLTVEEVAARLRVKEKTVRDWIGRGQLDAYKIRKEWRIRPEHLDQTVEAARVTAEPAPAGGLWDPDSAV
jgi:excisionase family DNA binding protein